MYNMDDTGLFCRLLPKKTYVFRKDKRAVRGTKSMTAKDITTYIVTANASGRYILPPILIGSAKDRRCFRLRSYPLPSISPRKAWNNGVTCNRGFMWHFLPSVRKRTSDPVALILDNSSSHASTLEVPNGQEIILHLPPKLCIDVLACGYGRFILH